MARNWIAMGIAWVTEEVSKRHGPNNSDKKVFRDDAEILTVTDVGLFLATPNAVAATQAAMDGSGFRIPSQTIGRKKSLLQVKGEDLREIVYASVILGARVHASAAPKTSMPDGTFYTGTNVDEMHTMYADILEEQGVDAELAATIASNIQLAK